LTDESPTPGVDLAALLCQEGIRGAAIAAYVLHVEAKHVLRQHCEHEIGRARAGGADAAP